MFHSFFSFADKRFLAATILPSNLTLKGTPPPYDEMNAERARKHSFCLFSPCKRGGEVKEIICLVLLGVGGGEEGRGPERNRRPENRS